MATIKLSESNNKQHIEIAPGDTIEIRLDESPTTGYKWKITSADSTSIEVTSEDFENHAGAGVGGGGEKIIRLKINNKSAGTLKLENRRSWNSEVFKKFEISYS